MAMRMRYCRPKCAGTTIKGNPCGMTAKRRKAEYWRKWRILNELAKTVPGYQQSRSPELIAGDCFRSCSRIVVDAELTDLVGTNQPVSFRHRQQKN
jgi:hypothetical protein